MKPFGEIETYGTLPAEGCAVVTYARHSEAMAAYNSLHLSQTMPGQNEPLAVKFFSVEKILNHFQIRVNSNLYFEILANRHLIRDILDEVARQLHLKGFHLGTSLQSSHTITIPTIMSKVVPMVLWDYVKYMELKKGGTLPTAKCQMVFVPVASQNEQQWLYTLIQSPQEPHNNNQRNPNQSVDVGAAVGSAINPLNNLTAAMMIAGHPVFASRSPTNLSQMYVLHPRGKCLFCYRFYAMVLQLKEI